MKMPPSSEEDGGRRREFAERIVSPSVSFADSSLIRGSRILSIHYEETGLYAFAYRPVLRLFAFHFDDGSEVVDNAVG